MLKHLQRNSFFFTEANYNAITVKLDEEKNSVRGFKGIISTEDSSIKVVVLPTDEEVMIARDTVRVAKIN